MDYKFLGVGELQPRPQSLLSPHFKRKQRDEDPGSGWSRVLMTNLSLLEESHIIRLLSPLVFVTPKADFVSL